VREQGTHDELLDREGLYAELYRTQFARRPSDNGNGRVPEPVGPRGFPRGPGPAPFPGSMGPGMGPGPGPGPGPMGGPGMGPGPGMPPPR
jgi:ATP-binding cassette subfamily B protein